MMKPKGKRCRMGRSTAIVFCQFKFGNCCKNKDIKVNKEKLQKSREYQKSNYNAESESVKAEDGAGIVLYAVSSSVRGSAKESQEAKAIINQAKREGKLDKNAVLNKENLKKQAFQKNRPKFMMLPIRCIILQK